MKMFTRVSVLLLFTVFGASVYAQSGTRAGDDKIGAVNPAVKIHKVSDDAAGLTTGSGAEAGSNVTVRGTDASGIQDTRPSKQGKLVLVSDKEARVQEEKAPAPNADPRR